MASQRPSFAKRDREMKLKDKARAKAERRAARKAQRANGDPPEQDDMNPPGAEAAGGDPATATATATTTTTATATTTATPTPTPTPASGLKP